MNQARRPFQSRTIAVWCEGCPGAVTTYIGRLDSAKRAGQEHWRPSGPHVVTQRLALRSELGVRLEVLEVAGRVAERYRLRCPSCGFDVIAGDRLGSRPGARSLWESPWGEIEQRVFDAARKTDVVLSKVADEGVSRLSLSALGRILTL